MNITERGKKTQQSGMWQCGNWNCTLCFNLGAFKDLNWDKGLISSMNKMQCARSFR